MTWFYRSRPQPFGGRTSVNGGEHPSVRERKGGGGHCDEASRIVSTPRCAAARLDPGGSRSLFYVGDGQLAINAFGDELDA